MTHSLVVKIFAFVTLAALPLSACGNTNRVNITTPSLDLAGSQIGLRLTPNELVLAQSAVTIGMAIGQPQKWQSTETSANGTFDAGPVFTTQSGQPCRYYTQVINVTGFPAHFKSGKGCQLPDKKWYGVN